MAPTIPYRVLVVHDERLERAIAGAWLDGRDRRSFQVELAESLEGAVAIADGAAFDVTVVALVDDQVRDAEVVETLRTAFRAPVVGVGEVGNGESRLMGLRAGAEELVGLEDLDQDLGQALEVAIERFRFRESRGGSIPSVDAIVANSVDGLMVVDGNGVVRFANPAAVEILGSDSGQLAGAAFKHEVARGESTEIEVPIRGSLSRTLELRAAPTVWAGDSDAIVVSVRDETERVRAQQELASEAKGLLEAKEEFQRLATIDPLTRMLNRRGLETAMMVELNRARRAGSTAAVLLIDIDDFKRVNDTLGYSVGDVVLREVARRLESSLRSTDLLGRVGGGGVPGGTPRHEVRGGGPSGGTGSTDHR